jgi:hypothetical protein
MERRGRWDYLFRGQVDTEEPPHFVFDSDSMAVEILSTGCDGTKLCDQVPSPFIRYRVGGRRLIELVDKRGRVAVNVLQGKSVW